MRIAHLEYINKLLKETEIEYAKIIPWSTPVYSFGNIQNSKLATLGINPSNREFENLKGEELVGYNRRFHTLNSLNISKWAQIDHDKTIQIKMLCDEYFQRNPYDQWFKKLDYLISGSSYSYYFPSNEACHLDLIPFATSEKWSDLKIEQQNFLLKKSSNFLGDLIKNSNIEYLILNGSSVIKNFEAITNVKFSKELIQNWSLNRRKGKPVRGYSYEGEINKIGKIELNREIKILGFNHNIQSSYGITNDVQKSIRSWISKKITI